MRPFQPKVLIERAIQIIPKPPSSGGFLIGQKLLMKNIDEELIIGSGGLGGGGKGSGGSSSVSDDPENLKSVVKAEVLFALSEGALAGFGLVESRNPADGSFSSPAESLYLNNTPVRSAAGTLNFQNIPFDWRLGYPDQDRIVAFSKQKREYSVGVTVRKGAPVTRTLVDDDGISYVTVRLRFPSLVDGTDSKGQLKQTTVEGNIYISSNGGAFVKRQAIKVTGRASNSYEKSYKISLPANVNNTWDIRVERTTNDSNSLKLQNDLVFQAFTTTESKGNAYQNTAILGISVPSSNFPGSVPEVAVDLRGMILRIPHNYSSYTRGYTGAFNGSLTSGWTNNPAWVLWDALTDTRYGIGLPESILDVYSFYDAGKYCDQLIPTGINSKTEPRYTFNAYITQRSSAYDLASKIASSFRANIYYSNGKIRLVLDRPKTATRLFSPANVVIEVGEDGTEGAPFEYSCTDTTTRTTAAIVRYINPQTWETDEEYYEDAAGIARWGYRVEEIDAFGCTSQGQAHRLAEWAVYTALHQTELLTFKIATEGLLVEPGDVIKIADPNRAGKRLGGRITEATTTSIKMDAPLNIEGGAGYVLSILDPVNRGGAQTEVAITDAPGAADYLTFAALPFTPSVNSLWMLTTSTLQPQLFQVLKVSDLDDDQFQIEAVSYDPSKFDYIERGAALAVRDITDLPSVSAPAAPNSVQIFETLYETTGSAGVRSRAQVFWAHPSPERVARYQIEYQRSPYLGAPAGTQWTIGGVSETTSYDLDDFAPGIYNFRVKAINTLGLESLYAPLNNKEMLGLTAPPADVVITGFDPVSNNRVRLSWGRSPDLDVRIGGYLEVRQTPKLSGVTQADGFIIAKFDGSGTSGELPLINGTYICRWVDSSGNFSVTPALVETSIADTLAINVIRTIDEASPVFAGKGYNATIDPTLNIVKLGLRSSIDNWPDIDSIPDWDTYMSDQSGSVAYGEYYLKKQIDLGATYTSLIRASFNVSVFNESILIDSVSGLMDDLGLFDGVASPNNADATLQISISNDLVNWTPYKDFTIGNYSGRAFRFRIILESFDDGFTSVFVRALSITCDMPDVTQHGSTTSGTGAATVVTFPSAFHQDCLPNVSPTLITNASGDWYTMSQISNTQFSIDVYNSSNARVVRSMSWIAKGFGKLSVPSTVTPSGNGYISSENGLRYFVTETGELIVPESNT